MLTDDDLGYAVVHGFRVVVLFPVNEEDQVGVLVDGTGLPQVGEQRPLVHPLLAFPAELARGDHGNPQGIRQVLQASGDLRDS